MGVGIDGEDWDELGGGGEEAGDSQSPDRRDRTALLAHLEILTGPVFGELARRLDLPRPRCRLAR